MTNEVACRERERLAVTFPTLKLDTSETPATVTGTSGSIRASVSPSTCGSRTTIPRVSPG